MRIYRWYKNKKTKYTCGLLLSQDETKSEEALKALSDALGNCYSQLYNIVIGYANAYGAQEKLEETAQIVMWFYQLGEGLREPKVLNWMDRGNVRLFTILAEVDFLRGNEQGACDWLRKAKETARRFDAAPDYHTGVGIKFYHGSPDSVSYDDMGDTAMGMIERYMADEVVGKNLRPVWAQLKNE